MEVEGFFRSANERIAARARELEFDSEVPFLCECADRACRRLVLATVEEYDSVRDEPARYLTRPGHELSGAARLVETNDRFAVSESAAVPSGDH